MVTSIGDERSTLRGSALHQVQSVPKMVQNFCVCHLLLTVSTVQVASVMNVFIPLSNFKNKPRSEQVGPRCLTELQLPPHELGWLAAVEKAAKLAPRGVSGSLKMRNGCHILDPATHA